MKKLIFPTFEYKTKTVENSLYIFDVIRRTYVSLSPEEWVRQHVVHTLITFKNYPKSLISIEKGLKVNKLYKRTDIVVFDKNILPFLVIECKAPEESINESVLRQALTYNLEKKAPYICITNGIAFKVFLQKGNDLIELNDFPEFEVI